MRPLYRRQLPQLLVGLWLYGATMALLVRAGLGLDPWDVFHQGLTRHLPLSFGEVTALVGVAVLLVWIPLRQKPGIGTILNIIVIAISVDATLRLVPEPGPRDIEIRCALLVLGTLGNGLAGALYVGANLGSGPRDGLWLAIVRITGRSVRQARTALEVTVLTVGFLLGGTVNFGTVFYALVIGHVVQFFLPRVRVLEAQEAPGSAIAGVRPAEATSSAVPTPAIAVPEVAPSVARTGPARLETERRVPA
ncbi:MAG: hypothetical protein REI11_16125 [Patulibacter sp.]|nr:hypothetical protein [Patulibacter sp.]